MGESGKVENQERRDCEEKERQINIEERDERSSSDREEERDKKGRRKMLIRVLRCSTMLTLHPKIMS